MNGVSGLPSASGDEWDRKFHEDLAADAAFEAGLLVKEIVVLAIGVALVLLRAYLL